jgi:hypothetical protein
VSLDPDKVERIVEELLRASPTGRTGGSELLDVGPVDSGA